MKCTHFVLAPIYTFTRYILVKLTSQSGSKMYQSHQVPLPMKTYLCISILNGFLVDSIQLVLPFFQSGKISDF